MAKRRASGASWAEQSDGQLLDLRLCDLGLELRDTALEARVQRLWEELAGKGLRFAPHVWLSTDWFTPDGVPGFAAPFYLAHPRLLRLERRQMLEVEGGGLEECMRILRHEAGHALDNAFGLRRRRDFSRWFGRPSAPYRSSYTANPQSRRYVLNLPGWYAQSHPLEDFAETFAVWLQPGSRWRKTYERWPALQKLAYVDHLMGKLRGVLPANRSRRRDQSVARLSTRLRDYYAAKQSHYRLGANPPHATALRQIFSDEQRYRRRESAAAFLSRRRVALSRRVATFSGLHRYTVDQVLQEAIQLSRELCLHLMRSERETHLDVVALLTARTMRFASGGRPLLLR